MCVDGRGFCALVHEMKLVSLFGGDGAGLPPTGEDLLDVFPSEKGSRNGSEDEPQVIH